MAVVRVQRAAPDMEDGDYTAAFLAEGSTFTLSGVIESDPIPVTRAWVEAGVLYLEGEARYAGYAERTP